MYTIEQQGTRGRWVASSGHIHVEDANPLGAFAGLLADEADPKFAGLLDDAVFTLIEDAISKQCVSLIRLMATSAPKPIIRWELKGIVRNVEDYLERR